MSFIPVTQVDDHHESPVDELRGVFGHFPEGLGAFDQMYSRMVGQGRLDMTLRLAIMGASARWRSDNYVASMMFEQAISNDLDASVLGALVEEAEGGAPTTADAALLAFCRKATKTAFKMVEADIETLVAHGWSNGQIVEATTMVSLSGYMSVMAAAGGLMHNPNLEPEPWR